MLKIKKNQNKSTLKVVIRILFPGDYSEVEQPIKTLSRFLLSWCDAAVLILWVCVDMYLPGVLIARPTLLTVHTRSE